LTPPDGCLSIDRLPGAVAFWVAVHPRARRPRVGGLQGDALRVAVSAAPTGGEANEACRRALAEALEVRRAAVVLEAGARSRRKRVRVEGEPDRLERSLRALAAPG
jgi:uncharacterized protein YggU (UPF0235/DUF167 family)